MQTCLSLLYPVQTCLPLLYIPCRLVSLSRADSSLFIYSCGTTLIYFLVYVDDKIITGNEPSLVDTIIRQLDFTFSTKDLRPLSCFCGVEVLATSSGLLLSQKKFVIDLLSIHNILGSKPISTLLVVGSSLTTNDGYYTGQCHHVPSGDWWPPTSPNDSTKYFLCREQTLSVHARTA